MGKTTYSGWYGLNRCSLIAFVLVAIDVGATSVKGASFDLDPAILAQAEQVTPTRMDELVSGQKVNVQWQPGGSKFWFVANNNGGVRYVIVDPEAPSIGDAFDHQALMSKLSQAAGQERLSQLPTLSNPSISFDKQEFTFEHIDHKWTFDIQNGELSKAALPGGLEPAQSPNGNWSVYTKRYNLFLKNLVTGKVRQLTFNGSKLKPYARPIVSLREMVLQGTSTPEVPVDIAWSPDSTKFATYQMDLTGARQLGLIQSTPPDSAMPRFFEYTYPLSGDEVVPRSQTIVFDVASGSKKEFELAPQDALYSMGLTFEWSRDSVNVLQRTVERGYKKLSLVSLNTNDGKSEVLTNETSDSFVDFYSHRWAYLTSLNAVFWISQSSGWNQANLIDMNGTNTQLTVGEWTVSSLAGNNQETEELFLVANGKENNGTDPYLRNLYKVSASGGTATRLTPESLDHDVTVSPDGRYFVDNMSLVNKPTRSVLRSTVDGEILLELQTADITNFNKASLRLPEPFKVIAADGVTPIYGVIYRPKNITPTKTYPVIEYIYTGPHSVTTPKSFSAGLKTDIAYSLTQLGFVIIVLDGRGTSGRGKEFLQHSYKKLHSVGLDDHILAIKSLAKRHSYLDISNVGIYGYSAGGYDVVRAMTERPDFYKVGISASGNHDNRLDKAIWNEQWLGYPVGPEYDQNSNVHWAEKLEGSLFLAHGELDENVPPFATRRLINALIDSNKQFEYMIFPNAFHDLSQIPYFNLMRFDFLTRKLLTEAK